MITVKLKGGLGNQMFQAAFGYAQAKLRHETLRLDTDFYKEHKGRKEGLRIFPELVPSLTRETSFFTKVRKRLGLRQGTYFQRSTAFVPSDQLMSYDHFDGYWQSEKFFADFKSEISSLFQFPELSPHSQRFLDEIRASESVAVHIRRGDYVTDPETQKVHGSCSLGFYRSGMDFFSKKLSSPKFFIFTDDIQWAYEQFSSRSDVKLVELPRSIPDWESMALMSFCSHLIISNSSFSWWAAWLNPSPEKIVVAPARWYAASDMDDSDLVPSSWMRISG